MKVLLEIKDNKVALYLEMLKSLNFVKKATVVSNNTISEENLSEGKKEDWEHIKKAFEQVELLKQGKLETRSAEELLNEL